MCIIVTIGVISKQPKPAYLDILLRYIPDSAITKLVAIDIQFLNKDLSVFTELSYTLCFLSQAVRSLKTACTV